MRLLCSPPAWPPRAAMLASADQQARHVALRLFAIGLHGGELNHSLGQPTRAFAA